MNDEIKLTSNGFFKVDNLTLRLATLAFGAWSFVVYHAADKMTNEMAAIHNEQTVTQERFEAFKIDSLQRITALEQQNSRQREELNRLENGK
jgi:hypothetical protein